jgi:hypothetical protein
VGSSVEDSWQGVTETASSGRDDVANVGSIGSGVVVISLHVRIVITVIRHQ